MREQWWGGGRSGQVPEIVRIWYSIPGKGGGRRKERKGRREEGVIEKTFGQANIFMCSNFLVGQIFVQS